MSTRTPTRDVIIEAKAAGTPADFGALANLVHMKQQPGSPVLINGVTLSLTNAQVERLLLAAKALWYALPELDAGS